MVGTRSQSAKKTDTQSDGERGKSAKSDVVMHDQTESDVIGNEKQNRIKRC